MHRLRVRARPLRDVGALASGAVAALTALGVASAQEPSAPGGASTGGPAEVGSGVTSFGIGDWFNLGLRLALVVAVIWAAVYAMRWYVRRVDRARSHGGMRALEVIETHALGPNRTLHLVRLGDRAVLVGATQERITQLLTVDDPDEFRRLTEAPPEEELTTPGRPLQRGGVGRAAGAMSLLASLRLGLVAMRARQSALNARLQAQRAGEQEPRRPSRRGASPHARAATALGHEQPRNSGAGSQRPASTPGEQPPTGGGQSSRFASLRDLLGRRERSAPPRPAGPDASEPAQEPEPRASLFDRTLASIDAIEVAPNGSRAAGAQARASYGRARAPIEAPGRSREAQIADLQRAIAAARKSAG